MVSIFISSLTELGIWASSTVFQASLEASFDDELGLAQTLPESEAVDFVGNGGVRLCSRMCWRRADRSPVPQLQILQMCEEQTIVAGARVQFVVDNGRLATKKK